MICLNQGGTTYGGFSQLWKSAYVLESACFTNAYQSFGMRHGWTDVGCTI